MLLRWHAPPAHAKVFYRILRQTAFGYYDYRLPPRVAGVRCLPPNGGAADCAVEMDTVGVTRGHTFVDTPGPGKGRWAYRIGVMGNWLNDVEGRRRDGRQRPGDRHSSALARSSLPMRCSSSASRCASVTFWSESREITVE